MTRQTSGLVKHDDIASRLIYELKTRGFAYISSAQCGELLGVPSGSFRPYAESWERLDPDRWMGDGGTYRKRRFAAFAVEWGAVVRKPHQPHYQSRLHNQLNGGVDRWFSPVEPQIADQPITDALLRLGDALGRRIVDTPNPCWHAEMHQFRIEAKTFESATPTPEGLHRDGVALVIMMLVARQNMLGGVTGIRGMDGRRIAEIELDSPLEMVIVDDRRVQHVVTSIKPTNPSAPAIRDALVLTFQPQQISQSRSSASANHR
ncbi:2OG-Fe dioxygenase family protein [Sphingomonas sp. H39-1-10]|uniref:2OG-Fe dioxygenase family protein n=1 Tax=Sphingomonadales TaxID=204457 RepID=UPI000C20B65C|nr:MULTISPECIES: 2OG-Fe dioxygenase family protein [Sphingomonadaceae]MDF0490128.1 2OG-Fe dioxygenase family protein [Sphingomonas pollutisoli]PJG45452.1 hypothetical protein CAF53_22165 [Sphingobium sp. LB126]